MSLHAEPLADPSTESQVNLLFSSKLGSGGVSPVSRNAGKHFRLETEVPTVISFSSLMGDEKVFMLNGVANEMHLALPVPTRVDVNRIYLKISGVASSELNQYSQLVVLMNGRVIQQFPLNAADSDFSYEVMIASKDLHAGYNDLTLRVAQHYTEKCEKTDAPQLWTQINLKKSQFSIIGKTRDIPASLSNLDDIFDKKSWEKLPNISVLTAQGLQSNQLNTLSLIAQGLANRYDYHPINISHGYLPGSLEELAKSLPASSQGAILVGSFNNLKPVLNALQLPSSGPGMIAINQMPNNPKKFILIFAAQSDDDLTTLARAFALKFMKWPDLPWVAINQVKIPGDQMIMDAFPDSLSQVDAIPIRALNFRTKTYYGPRPQKTTLKFWNNNWQGRIQVRLHLNYASGMSPQSAVNVVANGILHGTIPLNNPQGGRYENYAVTIPAGSLPTGWNTLEFEPIMAPMIAKQECATLSDTNLAVTIYEDTTIQEFGGNSLKQLDMSQLNGKGVPFTSKPLGQDISVQLADISSENIASGMTLIAKLTQSFEGPLIKLTMNADPKNQRKYVFLIGALQKLPETIKNSLDIKTSQSLAMQIPIAASATIQVRGSEWYDYIRDALAMDRAPPPRKISADIDMTAAFNQHTFMLTEKVGDQFFTVLTSDADNSLNQGINHLVDYGMWGQLGGRLAYWSADSENMQTLATEEEPFTAYGLRGGLGLWISKYPWISLLEILAIIILLVIATRRTLDTYKHRQAEHQAKD